MIHILRNPIVPFFLTIISTTACNAPPEIEITNVKSGLICLHKLDRSGDYKIDPRVCFATEDINITGQGECVFNGENKRCTWYGFEFDYENKTEAPLSLICHFSSDSDDLIGNPEGINEAGASSYELSLEPGTGRITNPQYTVFRYAPGGETSQTVNRCTFKGRDVFDARFNINLPATP